MKRRPDQSVGPSSWYWPTRYKLLVAALIATTVVVFFILVNPGSGGGSGFRAGSPKAIAQTVERMPIPPFNMFKLTGATCTLSSDHRHALCVGIEKFLGKKQPGIPVPSRPLRRLSAPFIVRVDGSVVPDCSDGINPFCAD